MEAFLALTVPFATASFLAWLILHFGDKRRQAAHDTVRLALEKGQDLSPELIVTLSLVSDPKTSDLRRGVILLSIGIAISVFGILIAEADPDARMALTGIAIFPAILGVAYLGLWRFAHGRKSY
ncbi:MAG: DUF6249 domain-containing protein [Pseudomonadota bacterium]